VRQQTSIKTLEIRRQALLKELAGVGPLVQGSFYERAIKCGKPNCRCARGEPHSACVLTKKVRGKTATTHVPRDLQREVQAWAQEYKRVKDLIKAISDLSEQIIRIHVRVSRAAARNRSRAKSTPRRSTPGC